MNPIEFKVLQTFQGENNNIYVQDMWYTIRPGNHDLLALAGGWLHRGLIQIDERDSRISGSGKIE